MTEIYRDQTEEGLFKMWNEAREVGATELCDEIWEKLLEVDSKQCKEKLSALRDRLNNLDKVDLHGEVIIGC
jgi:hypothetical protein